MRLREVRGLAPSHITRKWPSRSSCLAQDPGDTWSPELSPEGKAEFSRKSTGLSGQETQTAAFHEADSMVSS